MNASTWRRAEAVTRRAIRLWALTGGLVLVGLAVMTAASAVSNLLFNRPFAPDYELMKHFVAIAVFAFLPWCQLTGANVSVDIFTEAMRPRAKAAMAVLAALLAAAFAVLLLVQMSGGFLSYLKYPEVTPVLQLPLWTAFPPILLSLALLLVAAVITAVEALGATRAAS
jgi:TRAP-type C4-dicarboxylate transport system permease small subunit